MNSASEHSVDARTVEGQAVKWLIERDDAQTWTDEKQREFDAWLAQSPAHQTAFWRVEASWTRTELIADLRPFGFGVNRVAQSRSWLGLFRVAAGLGLFAMLGVGGALYFQKPEMQTFSTPVGGRRVITLLDGSQIELNTNTVVQIGTGENQRSVKLLQGEAFFQVHHDAAHAFTVAAAGHRVTDLGTKFLMRAQGENLEVTLLEGRASLEPEGRKQTTPVILEPGDVALATDRSVTLKKRPTQTLIEGLAWRKGILVFDNTLLADAAAEFNRYNPEKIVIGDMGSARFRLNGAIRVNDREEFTRIAKNLFGLHVEERGSETVIRR